jgi:hypothetical protein
VNKLKLLISLLLFTLFALEVGASYRETDFSPFPLSIKSEALLNGYWQSKDGFLEITEVKNYSINDHSWFIIYEIDPSDMNNKVINGFIFFDSDDNEYKRVFWTDDGLIIKTFILYRLEEQVKEPSQEFCVHTNTYMLKMNEEMFIRTECGL